MRNDYDRYSTLDDMKPVVEHDFGLTNAERSAPSLPFSLKFSRFQNLATRKHFRFMYAATRAAIQIYGLLFAEASGKRKNRPNYQKGPACDRLALFFREYTMGKTLLGGGVLRPSTRGTISQMNILSVNRWC